MDRKSRALSLDREPSRQYKRRFKKHRNSSYGTLPADLRRSRKSFSPPPEEYDNFQSLRRGFTLNGQPILSMEKKIKDTTTSGGVDSWYGWWTLYLILTLVCLINLSCTLYLLWIVGIGLNQVEVLSEESKVIFWDDVHFQTLIQQNGELSGFQDENLSIKNTQELTLTSFGENGPEIFLNDSLVHINNVHDFSLREPKTGSISFSTSDPEWKLKKNQRVRGVIVETTVLGSKGLIPDYESDLNINSTKSVYISGMEGPEINGKSLNLDGRDDIQIHSISGRLIVESSSVYLDTLRLPRADIQEEESTESEYELCICSPSGKLFKVSTELNSGCHSLDKQICALI